MKVEKGVAKRIVLSESSKMFDPLGWLAPILIQFQMFLQDLWIEGLNSGTPLNAELLLIWNEIKKKVLLRAVPS